MKRGGMVSILGGKMSDSLESWYKAAMSVWILNLTENVIIKTKPKYIYKYFFKSTETGKNFCE